MARGNKQLSGGGAKGKRGKLATSVASLIGQLIQDAVVKRATEEKAVNNVGKTGYMIALSMVGTEGQHAIITNMGQDVFVEAAQMEYQEEQDCTSALFDAAGEYSEAVEIILTEVGEEMTLEIEQIKESEMDARLAAAGQDVAE